MRSRLAGVIIVAVSMVLSSAILGGAFFYGRHQEKTIRVTGAATRRFGSDIIKWRASLSRSTAMDDIRQGYESLNVDYKAFVGILKDHGIDPKDLKVQPVSTNAVYNNNGGQTGYNISQSMYLVSKDVDKVEAVALSPTILVDKGVYLQSSSLEFYSSQLDDIKKQLLSAATRDARSRADRIAGSLGSHVDQISSAGVGVFQITEPYSTEVSDYGVFNTATRDKDITVTMNILFSLK